MQGKITDENNNPVAYASIFIKEAKQGTTTNTDGVFFINLQEGNYTIIFRCLGFETIEKKIDVQSGKNTLDIKLNVRPYQIAPVTIGSKSEDPAYSIIRKAIGLAPYYQNQIKEFNAEVYLKGTLKINKLSWVMKKAMGNAEDAPKVGQLYMQESINNIHFTAPNKYEQKVNMIQSNIPGDKGNAENVMQFVNASFYQPKIGEIILPLAPYALKYYNYKYDGFSIQEDRVINKIKVIPKMKSRQLVEGYIYIADDFWNLHEVDLTVESLIGTLRIKQTFGEIDNNAWLPISYNYVINGKFMGSEGDIFYVSSVKYSNVKLNTNLKTPAEIAKKQVAESKPTEESTLKIKSARKTKNEQKNADKLAKLMNKEQLSNRDMYEMAKLMDKQARRNDTSLEIVDPVTVTVDSSARKVDSIAWQQLRPVMLTTEELKINNDINLKNLQQTDSLRKDTLSKTKKSNVLLTIYMGKIWRNEDKKQTVRFSGLFSPNEFYFNTVDGFVLGGTLSYRREFEKHNIYLRPSVSYAFARKTPMGSFSGNISYSNKHRGLLGLNSGFTSSDFNETSGISSVTNTTASLWFGRNYMKLFENRYINIYNRIDPINGLEIFSGVTYSDRRMLQNSTDFIIYSDNREWYTLNIPENKLITNENLADNRAFTGTFQISYTPFYHYRVYGKRKIMMYSKFPTLKFQTKFGVPNILNSNADFINWETSLSQTIRMGPSNRLKYNFIYGDFLTKNKLFYNDFKHFNTSIVPVSVKGFAESYQNLNYYKRSTNSAYTQAFITYQSPYLALKYLPFLSNRIWQENIHLSVLLTKGYKPYYEFGYSLSQIGVVGGLGVFVSYEGQKFYSLSVKVSFLLVGFDM